MKKLKIFLFLTVLGLQNFAQTLSPKVNPTSGGYAIGNNGVSLSWTMGETFTTILSGGSQMLSQGEQQPEIDLFTGTLATTVCADSSFTVPYIAKGYVDAGNVFTAQLSNASGSFATPVNIGTVTATVSGIIHATIPAGTAPGIGYRVRVVSGSPERVATDNGSNITVNDCGCQNATGLTTNNITSSGAILNWSANADPARWQVRYRSTKAGSGITFIKLSGSSRTVSISGLDANQKYIWQIRAKCGKTWTAYTRFVSFKTLSSGSIAAAVISIGKVEATHSSIRLYPNPSIGQFMVELQIAEKINGNAKIQIIDLAGKTVQTENAWMHNGSIQRSITASPVLANGIYLIKIYVNNKTYITRLVYSK